MDKEDILVQTLLRLSRAIDRVTEFAGWLAYWLIVPMVLIGVWNVIGRQVARGLGVNLTSNALIEAQWYLFSIIFLLGAAYTLKHNGHVRVDVFYSNFFARRKAQVNVLGTALFLIPFCIIIILVSWPWIVNSWRILEVSNDPGGLPRYPIKSMIIVGFSLLLLQGFSELIKNLVFLTGHIPSQEE